MRFPLKLLTAKYTIYLTPKSLILINKLNINNQISKNSIKAPSLFYLFIFRVLEKLITGILNIDSEDESPYKGFIKLGIDNYVTNSNPNPNPF